MIPFIYSFDKVITWSTLDPQLRLAIIGLRQLRVKSTIGANDTLQPTAAASIPAIRPIS